VNAAIAHFEAKNQEGIHAGQVRLATLGALHRLDRDREYATAIPEALEHLGLDPSAPSRVATGEDAHHAATGQAVVLEA